MLKNKKNQEQNKKDKKLFTNKNQLEKKKQRE